MNETNNMRRQLDKGDLVVNKVSNTWSLIDLFLEKENIKIPFQSLWSYLVSFTHHILLID
jgi:hypothetical protein